MKVGLAISYGLGRWQPVVAIPPGEMLLRRNMVAVDLVDNFEVARIAVRL